MSERASEREGEGGRQAHADVCARGEIIVAVCDNQGAAAAAAADRRIPPSLLRGFQESLTGRATCEQEMQQELSMAP